MVTDTELLNEFVSESMLTYFKNKNHNLNESQIKTQLSELLKFLILTEHFPGNIIFGKEIDDLWHLWIMQTRQYDELCKKLPGGFFRHHSSKDYPEEIALKNTPTYVPANPAGAEVVSLGDAEAGLPHIFTPNQEPASGPQYIKAADRLEFIRKAERIISFFVTYRHNFGRVRQDVIVYWPPLERMIERLGWNADTLNAFLEQQIEQANQTAFVAAQ